MKTTSIKRGMSLVIVILTGLTALVVFPPDAFAQVTQELIAMFGLMMAGVLPTMVLTASVLRAGNLSVKKLIDYRDALRRQMAVWIGLFLISLVSSVFVIAGKMLEWKLNIELPLGWLRLDNFSFNGVRIINAAIAMALTLLVFRVIAVGNGIISLLGLSAEIAISEARARDDRSHKNAEAAIENMKERDDFGAYVELKH